MILPTATDILRCVAETIRSTIEPALADSRERSAAATVQHLLRLATHRIEREGQVLYDDIAALRALLADLAGTLCATWPADPAAIHLASNIHAGLDQRHRAAGDYPTLDSLAGEAGALRELLYACMRFLHRRTGDGGNQLDAQRTAIRRYVIWQLEKETELIEPAFAGRGPRR